MSSMCICTLLKFVQISAPLHSLERSSRLNASHFSHTKMRFFSSKSFGPTLNPLIPGISRRQNISLTFEISWNI